MKASKWTKPYRYERNSSGKLVKKTTLTGVPPTGKVSGAYLIYHIPSQQIVYVGKSHTQLYKTVYRHFQKWVRPKNNPGDFGYKTFRNANTYGIRVFTCTPKQADRLELYWINKYKPKYNSEKMAALFDQMTFAAKEAARRDAEMASYAAEISEITTDEVPF